MRKLTVSAFFLEDRANACPTLRIVSPLTELMRQGAIDFKIATRVEAAKVAVDFQEAAGSDVVVLQREAARKDIAGPLFEMAKRTGAKVVLEMDDLFIDPPPYNPHADALKKIRGEVEESLKRADAVTCTNPVLGQRLKQYNDRVYILPNYIDTDIWKETKPRSPHGGKTVVAYAGTPTHIDDLKMVVPAIKEILSRYGKRVEFRFWGCITEELEKLKGVVFKSKLIPDYREYAGALMGSDIDMVISPLIKNDFNESKSNIKYLEFSACGIPGVYSDIAPYSNCVTHLKTGVLSDDSTESWVSSMELLINDPALRAEIAGNARREILEKYTLKKNAYRWDAVLRQVAELNPRMAAQASLAQTRSGRPSLKVRCKDGVEKAIHSLYDPEAEAKTLADAFEFDGKGLLVVLGLGLGYHVAELASRYPDADILAIEASEEIYGLQKENGPALGDNVRVAAGLQPDEALKEITKEQMKEGIAPLSVFELSSAVSAFPEYYRPMLDSLKKTVSLRLWDRLKHPKFKEESMRVLLFDFDYFLTEEVAKALVGLGHEVVRISASKEDNVNTIISRVTAGILDFKPDFFLTINHLGFDEDGILTAFFRSIEMPVACWYVDSPNLVVGAFDKNVSPYVSMFLWDEDYIKDMESMGFEDVSYLPLATDEKAFRPISLSKKQRKKFGCDVGFVGNSMVEPVRERLQKMPKRLHPFVEKMAQLMVSLGMSFEDALRAGGNDLGALESREKIDLEGAVLWRATLLYRLSLVEALRGFAPHIHGDMGWKGLLGEGFWLGPPLRYFKDLPLFYNACKINFNATNLQMQSAVNQRAFDVPACGAFLLTDHQEALEDLFEVGKEVITYRDRDELKELVRFYLDNPGARDAVAKKGMQRALAEHTYKHRLEYIIQRMRKRYG